MALQSKYPNLIVDTSAFPEGEAAAIQIAVGHMALMDYFAANISSAVALIDYCEETDALQTSAQTSSMMHLWRHMAARDSALNIYHFCQSLEHIKSLRAPQFKRMTDSAFAQARQMIRAKFPNYRNIRHAVGHTTDFIGSIGKFREHSTGGTRYTFGSLTGRRFTVSYEGATYSFVIDRALGDSTREIASIVFEAMTNCGVVKIPASQ